MYIPEGVCNPWPIREDCMNLPDGTTEEEIEFWTHVASQILWALSGRKYGPCPITVRPCLKRCWDTYSFTKQFPFGQTGPYTPYIHRGKWFNSFSCGCTADCSCTQLCEVKLQVPVYNVLEVFIDGVLLDPADYRVDSSGLLTRQDGECWPDCQDLSKPAGEEGTFVVTYELGLPLKPGAIAAVSELASELIRACHRKNDCRLPKRAQRLTRNGVTIEFVDEMEFLDNGKTGLYLVDLWLKSVNPYGLQQPGRVLSPDYKPPRRTTWLPS